MPAADTGVLRQTRLAAGAATLPALEVGDSVVLTLFNDVEHAVALKERLESPAGIESFVASVSGYDGLANAVVVQSKEGLQVDVQDFRNARVYTVVSSAEGTTVREIDPKAGKIEPCQPLVPESNRAVAIGSEERQMALSAADQASTVVDILVAYDSGAAKWTKTNGGGLQNFAATAVAKMNTALANNGLDAHFRFRLVGTTELSVSASDVHTALYAVDDDDPGWAAVKTKRDEVGADIVTVLIDTGTAYGTTGVGWSLERADIASFADAAYNVCAVRSVARSHTMTHEVGHNMGAGHATAVNPQEISPGPQLYDYSAGYYFTASGTPYYTIMAYNYDGYGNDYESAPLFSSPNATWEGVAAGDAKHDNARTLQNTYLAVTRWRAQKVALSYDVFFSPGTETLFEDSVVVTLTPGKAGLPIRYTTDGSAPTLSSQLYSGPFVLKTTTTVKAATVSEGKLGPVYEARYLKSDLGTALNAPGLTWTTSSEYPWVTQTENAFDGFAVQSCPNFVGQAGLGKTSWLETTVTGPTEMGFRYQKCQWSSAFKVYCDSQVVWSDSEGGYGLGDYYDWNCATVNLSAGTHSIRFAFEQGYGYYSGFNGIVLDTVCFDAWSASPTISPATTASQADATTFAGSMTVTLTPPPGRPGSLFYTLDGSDPTQEGALSYEGPFTIDRSVFVQAVFVEPGREASPPAQGYFLERHPVKPGEWTTDVDGAKAAAAKDGKLIAVLCANVKTCGLSQSLDPVAESAEFCAWAAANGVYLISADMSKHIDAQTADEYYSKLYRQTELCAQEESWWYATFAFALPQSPETAIGAAMAHRNEQIGSVVYDGTVESLIRGFASVMGQASVLSAPTISPDSELVAAFPLTVTLTNPNGSGTIYYTLDGTVPTKTNGMRYAAPFALSSAGVTVKAAVWGASGLSSPVVVRAYETMAERLGTSGIVWTNDAASPWTCDATTKTLHSCFKSGTYTSTLRASVAGKGTLSFRLKASSNASNNRIRFKRNNEEAFSFCYDGSTSKTQTFSYELTATGTTTFEWSYQVSNSGYNFSQNGCYVDQIAWTPEAPPSTTTTPVAVPHTWIAANFPSAAAATYETLMNVDSDGDGFSNWQEYLCGTDPNNAGTTTGDSVPQCTIRMVNGLPEVGHNISIPAAAQTAGWRTVLKGTTGDFSRWSDANTAVHKFFKVVVEHD